MNLALKKEAPVIQHSNIENQTQEKEIPRSIKPITDPQTLTFINTAFKKKTTSEQIRENTLKQQNANHIAKVLKEMKLLNGFKFNKNIANYGINPNSKTLITDQISNLYKKTNRTKQENNLIKSIYSSQVNNL